MSISSLSQLILTANGELKNEAAEIFERIKANTNVSITISNSDLLRFVELCLIDSKVVDLEIRGAQAKEARSQLLSSLDALLGLSSTIISTVSPQLQLVINGRRSERLEDIMHTWSVSFYSPMDSGSDSSSSDNLIIVTGLKEDVEGAVKVYLDLAAELEPTLTISRLSVPNRKLDFLNSESYRPKLYKIMVDNAVHVALPPLSTGGTVVKIEGRRRDVERAERSVKLLVDYFLII